MKKYLIKIRKINVLNLKKDEKLKGVFIEHKIIDKPYTWPYCSKM